MKRHAQAEVIADLPASQTPFALPDRQAVLAASAPWLGALLNVLPGLGAGYLYQRRWRAWWITSALGALSFALGGLPPLPSSDSIDSLAKASLEQVSPVQASFQPAGLVALLLIAAVTAMEAFLAARRARIR